MPDVTPLRDALDQDPRTAPAPGDRAAAVLALLVLDPAPSLLFTERARTMSRHPGEVSFPGGLSDARDPTLVATALRETHEEVGIAPSAPDVLGALPPVHTFVSAILVTPFVAVIDRLPALSVNRAEIARAFTLSVAGLAGAEDRRVLHRDEHGAYHGWWYETGDAVVWGATGAMVHELLTLIGKEIPWMMS